MSPRPRRIDPLRAALLGALALCLPGTAAATADGPDFYRVTGVAPGDVLNVRASPRASGTKLGAIPHDADGIANFGCIGGLSLAEYQAATEVERAAARKTRWCKVGYELTIGWAAGWFLAEGSAESNFGGGARLGDLAGSAWRLRDLAGEAAAAEAWMAFTADGKVTGLGGCNRFGGGYEAKAGQFRFGALAATMMACPDPKARTESSFFKALEATRAIVATERLLVLFDGDGTVLAALVRRNPG
ncbi:MAG: META domain-containing protein [Rhodospirillales bacterium]|nr:MAG: META domain-containing protein [Rhodospirillales bacterium]